MEQFIKAMTVMIDAQFAYEGACDIYKCGEEL